MLFPLLCKDDGNDDDAKQGAYLYAPSQYTLRPSRHTPLHTGHFE